MESEEERTFQIMEQPVIMAFYTCLIKGSTQHFFFGSCTRQNMSSKIKALCVSIFLLFLTIKQICV